MNVSDVCTNEVMTIRPDETVLEAARRMREHHVGDLVVVEVEDEDRRPIGVLTDRDIVVGVIAQDVDHLAQLLVSDVVTSTGGAYTAEPDWPLSRAIQVMRDAGVRRLPVVNADGSLVGIVTADDVIGALTMQLGALCDALFRQPWDEAELRP